MRTLAQLALYLETRSDIWEKYNRTVFQLSEPSGRLTNRAIFFLKNPPPTSEADGIEIDLNNQYSNEDFDKLIRDKKGN